MLLNFCGTVRRLLSWHNYLKVFLLTKVPQFIQLFADGYRLILIILNVQGLILMNGFNIISHKGNKNRFSEYWSMSNS